MIIPGGEFLAGGWLHDEGSETFTVYLPAYHLARHPVTNAQYAGFMNTVRPGPSDVQAWVTWDTKSCIQRIGCQYETRPGSDKIQSRR